MKLSKMKDILRKVRRVGLWALGILFILFALQITALAFPQVIVSEKTACGSVTIYTDRVAEFDIGLLAKEVEDRLIGSRFYDSSRNNKVFYFQNQNLYRCFARLAMVTSKAQGFALSVFGNSYVDQTRILELASFTRGVPKYGIWEGSPAHIIAHEIGHLYLTEQIGREEWMNLPHWKQEGFPEYIANIASIRKDNLATLANRIKVLNDDQMWDWSNRWDRIHFEAELLVEFLLDVQGNTVEQIVADSVTREETLSTMLDWSKSQESGI